MPQDPFTALPQECPVQAETIAEQLADESVQETLLQPAYKPVYEPLPQRDDSLPRTAVEKTRLVDASPKDRDVICQVAFLEESKASPVATDPQSEPTGLNSLAIVPELAEKGATIIEERRNGREEFQGAWRPERVAGFWPQIEYLVDGGDDGAKVYVEEDWTVHNLETEDTIAHFDTLDGRTVVEPSNRVHLYAPRFAAVRKVDGILNNDQITALSGTSSQLALHVDRNKEKIGFAAQEAKTGYARTRDQLGGLGTRHFSAGADGAQNLGVYGAFESVMLYSNWLRQQSVGAAELLHLAEGSAGARAWQGGESVKVKMNSMAPVIASSEEGAESFFQIEEDESKSSKLRLIKVASKKTAQPGETVQFTLRFDNVGNQPIGNVTIIDSLTTRLEFLPGTAKSSLDSGFVVEPNDAGSFILRFEITAPLQPGQFGVVQFECRVR